MCTLAELNPKYVISDRKILDIKDVISDIDFVLARTFRKNFMSKKYVPISTFVPCKNIVSSRNFKNRYYVLCPIALGTLYLLGTFAFQELHIKVERRIYSTTPVVLQVL